MIVILSLLYGQINEIYNKRPFIYVYGTLGSSEETKVLKDEVNRVINFLKKKYGSIYRNPLKWFYVRHIIKVKPDTQVTVEDLKTKSLILYATYESNLVFEKIKKNSPIKVKKDTIIVGEDLYIGSDKGAIWIMPNPYKYILIYFGCSMDAIKNVNNVFHGPTDYVIFNESCKWDSLTKALAKGYFDKSNSKVWKVRGTNSQY